MEQIVGLMSLMRRCRWGVASGLLAALVLAVLPVGQIRGGAMALQGYVGTYIDGPTLFLSFSPSAVPVGGTTTGTVTLAAIAQNDTVVGLTCAYTGVEVPPIVLIPAGEQSATFVASVAMQSSAGSAVVSATTGVATAEATIDIGPDGLVSRLTFSPPVASPGQTITGKVELTAAAPNGGTVVSLASDDAEFAVPESVTIPPGSTAATFTATVGAPAERYPVAVWAQGPDGSVATTAVEIGPVTLGKLEALPAAVVGGASIEVQLSLTAAAPPGGFVVTVGCTTSTANWPSTVVVPAGQTSATFQIRTCAVAERLAELVTCTASDGVSLSASIRIDPLIGSPQVRAYGGNRAVTLYWEPVDGAVAYRVYRARANAAEEPLMADISGVAWVDTGLDNGVSYRYRVTAMCPDGEGLPSVAVLATPRDGVPASELFEDSFATTISSSELGLESAVGFGTGGRQGGTVGPIGYFSSADSNQVNVPTLGADAALLLVAAGGAQAQPGWASPDHDFTESGNLDISLDMVPLTDQSPTRPSDAWVGIRLGASTYGAQQTPADGGFELRLHPNGYYEAFDDGRRVAQGDGVVSRNPGLQSYRVRIETATDSGRMDGSPATITVYLNDPTYPAIIHRRVSGLVADRITLAAGGGATDGTTYAVVDNLRVSVRQSTVPAAPVVGAVACGGSVAISWLPVPGAAFYNIFRAESATAPPRLVAGDVAGTGFYDAVQPSANGAVYTVTAANSSGQSAASAQAAVATSQSASPIYAEELPDANGCGTWRVEWYALTTDLVPAQVLYDDYGMLPLTARLASTASWLYRDELLAAQMHGDLHSIYAMLYPGPSWDFAVDGRGLPNGDMRTKEPHRIISMYADVHEAAMGSAALSLINGTLPCAYWVAPSGPSLGIVGSASVHVSANLRIAFAYKLVHTGPISLSSPRRLCRMPAIGEVPVEYRAEVGVGLHFERGRGSLPDYLDPIAARVRSGSVSGKAVAEVPRLGVGAELTDLDVRQGAGSTMSPGAVDRSLWSEQLARMNEQPTGNIVWATASGHTERSAAVLATDPELGVSAGAHAEVHAIIDQRRFSVAPLECPVTFRKQTVVGRTGRPVVDKKTGRADFERVPNHVQAPSAFSTSYHLQVDSSVPDYVRYGPFEEPPNHNNDLEVFTGPTSVDLHYNAALVSALGRKIASPQDQYAWTSTLLPDTVTGNGLPGYDHTFPQRYKAVKVDIDDSHDVITLKVLDPGDSGKPEGIMFSYLWKADGLKERYDLDVKLHQQMENLSISATECWRETENNPLHKPHEAWAVISLPGGTDTGGPCRVNVPEAYALVAQLTGLSVDDMLKLQDCLSDATSFAGNFFEAPAGIAWKGVGLVIKQRPRITQTQDDRSLFEAHTSSSVVLDPQVRAYQEKFGLQWSEMYGQSKYAVEHRRLWAFDRWYADAYGSSGFASEACLDLNYPVGDDYRYKYWLRSQPMPRW